MKKNYLVIEWSDRSFRRFVFEIDSEFKLNQLKKVIASWKAEFDNVVQTDDQIVKLVLIGVD